MLRPRVPRLFRLALRRRDRLADDIRTELESHLASLTEHLEARGFEPHAARAEALRRLGPLDDTHQRLLAAAQRREDRMRFSDWLDATWHDLRDAVRVLHRAPAFSVLVIVTIALAVGANGTMFGVIDRLLLSGPRHVTDPASVRRLYVTSTEPGMQPGTEELVPYVTYTDLRDGMHSFTRLAAHSVTGWTTLGRGADAQRVYEQQATWTLFPLLGVRPHLGRFFGPDEDHPPVGEPVVVIGFDLWRTRFGADSTIIGRSILVDDERYTIIGVAPRGFTGAQLTPVDIWMPVSVGYTPREEWATTRQAQWLTVLGRLAPGVSAEQASDEATAVHRHALGGLLGETEVQVSFLPLHFSRDGRESTEVTVARWLVGVAVVVLLVACANVTNLMLARAVERRREVAVRLALGVSRSRLVRLLLAEAALLALIGGAVGLAFTWWGAQLVRTVLLPGIVWDASPVDLRVLLFTLAASIATALLVGVLPAMRAGRTDPTVALKEGGAQAGGTRSRLRASLVLAQAALSVVLLVGAGLFVQSLWNVRSLDLGIEADRVLMMSMSWWQPTGDLTPEELARERARRLDVRRSAVEAIRRHPGVAGAAWGIGTPFYAAMQVDLRVPGWDSIPALAGYGPYILAASPGYFDVVGTSILRGRPFDERDHAESERVAIVNETMARTLWPGESPLGKCLFIGYEPPGCSRVVGVAEDARRFRLREEAAMQYYVPLGQETGISGQMLLVRPRGDAGAFLPELRRLLRGLDPTLDLTGIRLLQDAIDPQIRPWRLGATVFVCFGVLAMLVAAVGMYSVASYVTAQRTHELGVRTALGAGGAHIAGIVIGRSLVTAGVGAAIGSVIALLAGPSIEPLLFDTSPTDPRVLAITVGALMTAAVIATLPAVRRAMRVDPVVALRTE